MRTCATPPRSISRTARSSAKTISWQLTINLRAENIVHSRNTGPFSVAAPGSADPATNLLSTRLSFRWAGYEVAGFVNNVFNSLPILGWTPVVYGYPLTFTDTFRPRTIGVSGSVRF